MRYQPNVKFARGRRQTFRVKNEVLETAAVGNHMVTDVTDFGPLIVRDSNAIGWRDVRVIYDRIEYTFNGDRKQMNMCRHDRTEESSNNVMNYNRVKIKPSHVYGWEKNEIISTSNPPHHLNRPDYAYYSHPLVVRTVPLGLDVLESRKFDAYQRLRADVSATHMNVLRSVIELKDTKQTGKGITSFCRWLRSRRNLSSATSCRQAAQLYLTYQFGIAPTLDDVNRFIKELRSDKIRFVGNPTQFKGKEAIVETSVRIRPSTQTLFDLLGLPESAEWTINGWYGSNGSSTIREVDNMPRLPVGWASKLTRFSYTPIQGKLFARVKTAYSVSKFDTFLRKFAWSCPLAQTAWDLMPYTFLIDWFFDIGSLLARLEREMAVAIYRINMDQAWEGFESSTELCGPVLEHDNFTAMPPRSGSKPIWTYTKSESMRITGFLTDVKNSTYVRQVYVPPALWDLIPPLRLNLDAYQLSAGAALLITHSGARSARVEKPRIPPATKIVDWDRILKDYNHHWKDF